MDLKRNEGAWTRARQADPAMADALCSILDILLGSQVLQFPCERPLLATQFVVSELTGSAAAVSLSRRYAFQLPISNPASR